MKNEIEELTIDVRRAPNGLFQVTRTVNGAFNGSSVLHGSAVEVAGLCLEALTYNAEFAREVDARLNSWADDHA